jgi:hypothetical protein
MDERLKTSGLSHRYNGFFHGVLPKVQTAVLTGGYAYGIYLVMFVEAQR